MTAGSPRNPNICAGCEQLLEDDGGELHRLIASVESAEPAPKPPVVEPKTEEVHVIFSGFA